MLQHGLGVSKALLRRRFPNAELFGVDVSPADSDDVLDCRWKPRAQSVDDATPQEQFDLIFSNGAQALAPKLRALLPMLIKRLTVGGRLAIQVPNDLQEPYRALLRMVAVDGPWADELLPIAKTQPYDETVRGLYDLVAQKCRSVEIWETIYVNAFESGRAIAEWMRKTNMAPFLKHLDDEMAEEFVSRYAAELARSYPPQGDGKLLLRLPRLALLAQC